MTSLFDIEIISSFVTLSLLEVVLGIDNVIFISIVANRLAPEHQARARQLGLAGALIMRVLMLASIVWIVGLTAPIITISDFVLSWRDLILIGGGLFLLTKGTWEIHEEVEGDVRNGMGQGAAASFAVIVTQIMLLDVVFSLDSVITAVGMTQNLPIMIAAVVVAIAVMMVASEPVSAFIVRHPTTKMLALSFLLLVGVALVADGLHFHIPRGYLYFAIAFSLLVETLNIVASRRKRRQRGG